MKTKSHKIWNQSVEQFQNGGQFTFLCINPCNPGQKGVQNQVIDQ